MIETTSTFISKLDGETLKVVLKNEVKISYEEYDSLPDLYRKLIPEGKIKFLVIMPSGFNVEGGYMKLFKEKFKTNFKKAEAYIILSPTQRTFFKLGQIVVKNEYPAKLFRKEEEAFEWLKNIE